MAVIAAPCVEPRVNQPRDAATAPAERLGRALEMAMKEARVAVLEPVPVLEAVLGAVLEAVLEAVEEEEAAAAHRAAARACWRVVASRRRVQPPLEVRFCRPSGSTRRLGERREAASLSTSLAGSCCCCS